MAAKKVTGCFRPYPYTYDRHTVTNTMSDHQDWTPVTIRGAAASQGRGGGGKVTYSHAAASMRRAESDDAPAKPKVLSMESVRAIQDYRRANSKTQKELDQLCSFPAGTINALEGRRTGPTPRQLQDLNRLLKAGLTLE